MATYFWRAKCRLTGRELKFRTDNLYAERFDDMQAWVEAQFRNLELLEYAPWDDKEHGGGILYKVPVQNVKFHAPKLDVTAPDPRRVSLLVRPIERKRLLRQ